MSHLFAIILGGSLGSIIRWQFAIRLNGTFSGLALGTLLVNLSGGLIIGAALAWFLRHPDISQSWRLLIMSGFCGGMTTFSTFSVEVFLLFQSGHYLWATTVILLNLLGSLGMTALGFYIMTLL